MGKHFNRDRIFDKCRFIKIDLISFGSTRIYKNTPKIDTRYFHIINQFITEEGSLNLKKK